MTPEATEARRQYLKQWRRDHPEACKRYRENYWTKKGLELEAAATQQKGKTDDDKQASTN